MTEKTFDDYANMGCIILNDYDFAPHEFNYGFSRMDDDTWETYMIGEWRVLELTKSEIENRFREVFPDTCVAVDLDTSDTTLGYSTRAYINWLQPEVTGDANVEETFKNNDAVMTKLVHALYRGEY